MSVLKRSVFVVAVLLFALVPLNDAACWTVKKRRDLSFCWDTFDKIWRPLGSSWTNGKCESCHCDSQNMQCCHRLPTSIDHPDDCTVEYDYRACTYRVFKKNDRSVECPHGAIGK